jgi:hypothetical protein
MTTESKKQEKASASEFDLAREVAELLKKSKDELERYFHLISSDQQTMDQHLLDLKADLIQALVEIKKIIAEKDLIKPETAAKLKVKISELEMRINKIPGNEKAAIADYLSDLRLILSGILSDLFNDADYHLGLTRIGDRTHRLKIKLDILRLKLELGKMDLKQAFQEGKETINDKIESFKKYTGNQEKRATHRIKNIRTELTEAYEHLNKAFTKK